MNPNPTHPPDFFPQTQWTTVRRAYEEHQPDADRALNELFQMYERPIFVYILSTGHSRDRAEDLKQSFFAHLLERNSLALAAGTHVKLRAYLLTKLRGFLIDQHRRETAQKRGGGRVASLAELTETQALLAEPVDEVTPLVAFQRQWMSTLASNAMESLRRDYQRAGKEQLFSAIAPFITQSADESLSTLAARLGRLEGTLKSDISRLRSRCQQIIREQIAATLDDPTPANIDAELKELMGYRA